MHFISSLHSSTFRLQKRLIYDAVYVFLTKKKFDIFFVLVAYLFLFIFRIACVFRSHWIPFYRVFFVLLAIAHFCFRISYNHHLLFVYTVLLLFNYHLLIFSVIQVFFFLILLAHFTYFYFCIGSKSIIVVVLCFDMLYASCICKCVFNYMFFWPMQTNDNIFCSFSFQLLCLFATTRNYHWKQQRISESETRKQKIFSIRNRHLYVNYAKSRFISGGGVHVVTTRKERKLKATKIVNNYTMNAW